MALALEPYPLAQVAVNTLPSAVVAPAPEVAIDGLPRREVRGQHPPGTASPQDVQDGLDHGSQVGFARPPQRGISGEVDGEYCRLRVAQPRGIGWGSSFYGLSSFGFGRIAYTMEAP